MVSTLRGRSAAFDVGAVLTVITLAWAVCRWWLYPALGIANNAPVILRPISGFLLACWLLLRRGENLRVLGLRRPSFWSRAALVAIVLYAVLMLSSRWVTPLLVAFFPPTSKPSFIAYIHDNLRATLSWLGIGWVVGAFCEEVLFRGFLLNRVAAMFGDGKIALGAGVVAQALLFGALHYYAGAFACAHATVFALVMGMAYVASGRNLWPLIAVHGTWDSIGIWSVYSG